MLLDHDAPVDLTSLAKGVHLRKKLTEQGAAAAAAAAAG
jgi:hypothetical protein